jgi:hypothetical protein
MQTTIPVIYRLVVRNDRQDLTEYGLLAALIVLERGGSRARPFSARPTRP